MTGICATTIGIGLQTWGPGPHDRGSVGADLRAGARDRGRLLDLTTGELPSRKNHPALWRGIHTALNTEGDALVYSQKDAQSNDLVIVAINRETNPASISIPAPAEWSGKKIRERLERRSDGNTRRESGNSPLSHALREY